MIPPAEANDEERADYAKQQFETAISELTEAHGAARHLTAVIAVVVALEGNLFGRLLEQKSGSYLLPLAILGVVIGYHLWLFLATVGLGISRPWLRAAKLLRDIERTSRGRALGVLGLIEDEYVSACGRARRDTRRVSESTTDVSRAFGRSLAVGMGSAVALSVSIEVAPRVWAALRPLVVRIIQ